MFTVLDAKDGFLQVKINEDSSKLTTFHTSFGRWKWLRMPFGICSALEEFQRHVTGAGNTHEKALADHDRNLIVLLKTFLWAHPHSQMQPCQLPTAKFHRITWSLQ